MKRIFCMISLALALVLALSGCGPHITLTSDEDFQAAWGEAWTEWKNNQDRDGPDTEKNHYYQILDSQETLLCTVSGEEGVSALDTLLSDDGSNWGERLTGEASGEITCIYCYWQEKTLLAGQDPDAERDYEELVRFTVYQDRDVVTLQVLSGLDALELPGDISVSDLLTFTYSVPAETAAALRDPAQFAESE